MAFRQGLGGAPPALSRAQRVHSYTEVAAGVCLLPDGRYLLAQRPAGKPYAGYWEFPGGKVEPGETPAQALARELKEELAIEPTEFYPWITRTHHYEHASVRLRFFRIAAWRGDFECREFQRIEWQRPGHPTVTPMLPANGPILRALELPAVIGVSMATQLGPEVFLERLQAALQGGLRMVILREKAWPLERILGYAKEVSSLCRAVGALCLVNTDPVHRLGADLDGIHLTAARLMRSAERPAVGWCGASCHDATELAQAQRLALDYVVLGPVLPTPSHPGAQGLGWSGLRTLAQDYPLPVYAIGGQDLKDLKVAWQHGAHGIAMMRGAWEGNQFSVVGGAFGSGVSSEGTR